MIRVRFRTESLYIIVTYNVHIGSEAYPASNTIGTRSSLYVSKEAVENFRIKCEEIKTKTRGAVPLFLCMSQLRDA